MKHQSYPQSATKRLIELTHGRPVEALLRGYSALGWSQGEIAEKLGVSRLSIHRWMREYGISTQRPA